MQKPIDRRKFMRLASSASVAAVAVASGPALPANRSRLVPDSGWTTTVERDVNRFTYRWSHYGRRVEVAVDIDPAEFIESDAWRRLSRMEHDHGAYIRMAEEDPYRRAFLRPVVNATAIEAQRHGEDPAGMLLTLVQGLPYKDESDYQSWPTETLLQMHGDCSDTAVLYSALLERYQGDRLESVGKQPIWCLLKGTCRKGHLMVGVRNHGNSPRYSGTHFKHEDQRWYTAETTGTGFRIGDDTCLDSAKVLMPHPWA